MGRARAASRVPVWLAVALFAIAGCATTEGDVGGVSAGKDHAARADEPVAAGKVWLVGARSFTASRLERVMADELADDGDGLGAPELDDAAWILEDFYRGQGFPSATVVVRPAPPGAEVDPRPTLVIDEGVRALLAGVEIAGNTVFSSADLAGLVGGPFVSLFGTDRWYVENELATAADAMRRAYNGKGYLRMSVAPPQVRFGQDGRDVYVRFEIAEGRRYQVTAIELPELPVAIDVAALRSEFVGKPYQEAMPYELRARLLDVLGQAGHADPQIRVTADVDHDSGNVVLSAAVDPGPVVTVGEVRVQGNESTATRLILERMVLKAGEPWTSGRQRESFNELYESGLFRSIRITLEGEGEQRDVLVVVEESLPIELYVQPGYGSYEGMRLQVGARQKNLWGLGYQLGLDASVSQKVRETTLSLTDPRFLGSRVSASVSVFADRSIEPAFTQRDKGVGLNFARTTGNLRTSLGYRFRRTHVGSVQAAQVGNVELAEDGDVGSVVLTPVWDTRDQVFAPTTGSRAELVLEVADASLLSTIEFQRVTLQEDLFLSLGTSTVLGLSARAGVVVPSGDQQTLPISERFFNGGQDSVRSFREGELGPKDAQGVPLGGETFTVFSVELRQALTDLLSGALFYDLGNVETDHERFFDLRDMRAGVGVGLRFMLPVGPVRFDVAANPNPRTDENRWVTHLAVGMAF